MTTKQQRTQGYIVIDQHTQWSNYNGRKLHKIEFVGVADRKIYHTYIQKTNKNFNQWSYIIERADQGIVLTFHNFEIKDLAKCLISADSVPKIEMEANLDQIMHELKAMWDVQDAKRGNTIYSSLFDLPT